MGISSAGIGSGIDVNSIVTQLMNAERIPLTTLQSKESSYNTKLSAYGKLKGTLETFQSSLTSLSSSSLNAKTATSSNTELLDVTAGSTAAPGMYSIKINSLAQEHKIISSPISDPTAKMASGTMEIKIGNTVVGNISGEYTLQGLTNAINASNAGISATIFNDGTETRLMVSANNTGAANVVSITASGGIGIFATSGSGTMVTQQKPEDAKITINGMSVTKPSNTITDAISGLTLKLKGELKGSGLNTVINVGVEINKEVAKSAVSNFVSAYNTLSSTIKTLTAYDAVTKTGAALNGDLGAKSILNSLRAEITKAVSSGDLTTLSAIGVGFQRDGTLAIDNTKLQKALDTKFENVVNLFSSETGYATRLKSLTDGMLSSRGSIASRTDGLKDTIKSIVKDQEALQVRLEATQKRLKAQFTALDTMLSSMQQTSSYLTQQIAALSANSSQ